MAKNTVAKNMRVVAVARLPTVFGEFNIVAFENAPDGKEHVALVKGMVRGKKRVPVRIHSECLTGDALGSLKCDCRQQLETALRELSKRACGVLIYLRQEGRGIGLANKIKAYHLQEHGFDTFDANMLLGFADDLRDYSVAAEMLKLLEVKSIELLTNNPVKIKNLKKHGVRVVKRIPLKIKSNAFNKKYLNAKKKRGHLL